MRFGRCALQIDQDRMVSLELNTLKHTDGFTMQQLVLFFSLLS